MVKKCLLLGCCVLEFFLFPIQVNANSFESNENISSYLESDQKQTVISSTNSSSEYSSSFDGNVNSTTIS